MDDLDLYADGFNPVLSPEGRSDYHEVPKNRELVDDYVSRLQACEALVLCHPVWNFGWPAILKGYFDRVFLPEVSFVFQKNRLGPGLTNIRRLTSVTTYGSKRWRAMVLGDAPRKNGTRTLASSSRLISPVSRFIKPDMSSRFSHVFTRSSPSVHEPPERVSSQAL